MTEGFADFNQRNTIFYLYNISNSGQVGDLPLQGLIGGCGGCGKAGGVNPSPTAYHSEKAIADEESLEILDFF